MSPPINLSNVDLPQPEGPTSVMNSFCRIVRLTCASAVTRPPFDAYVFSKPSMWILFITRRPAEAAPARGRADRRTVVLRHSETPLCRTFLCGVVGLTFSDMGSCLRPRARGVNDG